MLGHILMTCQCHVHTTAPCSAHALTQARPTMSYIPLVTLLMQGLLACIVTCSALIMYYDCVRPFIF